MMLGIYLYLFLGYTFGQDLPTTAKMNQQLATSNLFLLK